MKRVIKASENIHTSQISVDFIWEEDYDINEVENAIESALDFAGVECTGIDIRSVDYSMYPEFKDDNISQVGADFEYEDDYDIQKIETFVNEEMMSIGLECVGISFEGLED